jgi:hypothetical protein
MLCFAKMLLAPHRSLLRITLGGAAAPPNHPGVFDFPVFTAAHSFMRTNIPVNKEDIADWLLQHPQAKSLSPLGVFSTLALLCTPRALRKGLRAGFGRQSAGLPALSLTAFGATPVSVALLRLPSFSLARAKNTSQI